MNQRIFSLRTLVLGNALVVLIVLSVQMFFPGAYSGFELKTIDNRFHLRHFLNMWPVYSDSLVHINIDNYSKQASAEALWAKAVYAELIGRIAAGNPEAIASDIMFVEQADNTGNQLLIDSVIAAGYGHCLQGIDVIEYFQ